MWQPIANQYLNPTFQGSVADVYPANIVLPNGREGLVVTAWAYDPGNQTSFIPVNLSILQQQADGTLSVATTKYVGDSQTNGSTTVVVADFNNDGIPDIFLPPYNETPNLPTSSIAYLSNASGTYSKVTVGDLVNAQDGVLSYVNGTPTVFTGSYYQTASNGDTAASFKGAGGFTINPNIGIRGSTSIAVADFYGTDEYSAIVGDFVYGSNPTFGIYGFHLSQLMASGDPFDVGNPYFDQPAYAGYQSFLGPNGTQSSFRIWTDDFNHDGMMDILVEGEIWNSTLNFQKDILQMFQNVGNYQFTDVTDAFNSQYDKNCGNQDAVPQSRDIDGSGINSYLLSAETYSSSQSPCSYVILNDGTGNLQIALYQTLTSYGKQVTKWLLSPYGNPMNQVAAFPGYFINTDSSPLIRAYQTPNGLLNFLAIVGGGQDPGPNSIAPVTSFFVNIPLQLDVSTQFTRPISIVNRNGSHAIRTFAGDDTIYSGNDGGFATVDGGLGTNTVVYSGPSQNYSAAHNSDGAWTIKDNVGTDGTDTLTRIQRLQFTDLVVRLDSPSVVGPASAVMIAAGGNQSATVSSVYPAAMQVKVTDFLGNPVPNISVTFTAPNSGPSGAFANSQLSVTTTTNNAGLATAPAFTANSTSGSFKVMAIAAGVVAPAVFTLSNTPPPPAITSVMTASGGSAIAQNTWVVIKGKNLVPGATPASGVTWSSAPDFASGQMPTQLPGYSVTVTVNNKPAFIYFLCSAVTSTSCNSDQINVLTPLDSTVGPVPVVVTNAGSPSNSFTVNMEVAAASFPLIGTTQYVVATHADSLLVGPASLSVPGYPFAPAKPGETIVLYGFGFGLPTTTLLNGASSQSGQLPTLPVIQIGGAPATVTFAGVISPGLYQFNVVVPSTAQGGDNTVSCSYAGSSSPAGDLIAIQQ